MVSATLQNFQDRHLGWAQSIPFEYVTKAELTKLREELEELKKVIAAAKEYDEKTNQPECEDGNKVKFIKELAEFLKVDLKDVL